MTMRQNNLRERYETILPQLVELCNSLTSILQQACQDSGIYSPRIDGRAKATHSFLLKAFRKERDGKAYSDPIREMSDKVGVRADLIYYENINRLIDYLRSLEGVFEPIADADIDDKQRTLGENEIGYSGVHINVVPLAREGLDRETARCEIQIRTNAQAAWAMASHELVYKPLIELTASEKRRVNRLTALLELFDEQVAQVNSTMKTDKSYPLAKVLDALKIIRFRFNAAPFDHTLTRDIASKLVEVNDAQVAETLTLNIESFANEHANKLKALMQKEYPLLSSQPEALLIFYQLENIGAFELKRNWTSAKLPYQLLDDMATAWGVSIPRLM